MGDIAEMMLDGTLDSMTSEYLGEPTGYPRSLDRDSPDYVNRWGKAKKPKAAGYDPSRNAQFGAEHFIRHKMQWYKHLDGVHAIIRAYGEAHGVPSTKIKKISIEISKNWPVFMTWFKNNYKWRV
jgi:hypothetical protein